MFIKGLMLLRRFDGLPKCSSICREAERHADTSSAYATRSSRLKRQLIFLPRVTAAGRRRLMMPPTQLRTGAGSLQSDALFGAAPYFFHDLLTPMAQLLPALLAAYLPLHTADKIFLVIMVYRNACIWPCTAYRTLHISIAPPTRVMSSYQAISRTKLPQ